MPGYKTHLVGGLTTFFVILMMTETKTNIQPEQLFFYLFASLLGSIFPDIDIPSKMQNIFYTSATMIILVALLSHSWKIFFFTSFFCFIIPLITHRTLTHRIWFLFIFPLLTTWYISHFNYINQTLLSTLAVFFIGGTLSHIFLDKTTTKSRSLLKRKF